MAEVISPMGIFKGRLGSVTFYENARGKNLCRSLTHHRKASNGRQREWERHFGTVIHALPYLLEAVQAGFPGQDGFPKGYHGFVKANVHHTVTADGNCPHGRLDFEKLQFSAGRLAVPDITCSLSPQRDRVRFRHEGCRIESYNSLEDDRIYGVVVNEPLSFCKLVELCRREEDCEKELALPEEVELPSVHVYAFATSADGRQASPTLYLGPEAIRS